MIKKALTTVISTFYQQLVHLPYNRLQVNAKLLLFFWKPKKGRVLILKYEKGRVPKKKGRRERPAKSA